MPDPPEVIYGQQVKRFTDTLLAPYIARLQSRNNHPTSVKEINDTVWQTIVVYPFEILIIDSPLFQRLRRIRQLGVGHYTYPSAGHTRFEHSLGTLHQMERLLDSFERSSQESQDVREPPRLSKDWRNLLRLAALCHDIGHGLMSHVVENALRLARPIEDLKLGLADSLGLEKVSLSEAAAYFMFSSEGFQQLIEFGKNKTGHQLPNGYSKLLQSAIVGSPIHDRYPLLQELITGPFDADKLDYMTRDARMTGVPTVTDIPRLIQKMRVVEIAEAELPSEIAKHVSKGQKTYFVQAIALSGARTLDELMIGRTLLYDKVYRHQKLRSAEAMIASIIELLAPLTGDKTCLLPLLFEDDDLLNLTPEVIQRRLGRNLTKEEVTSLFPALDISARIRDRNLFTRAYSFAHNMPRDPFRLDDTHKNGLEKLRREVGNADDRSHLLEAIISEILRMRQLLPAEIAPNMLDLHLKSYVGIDMPDAPRETGEIARAYLVTGDGELLHFREDSAESSGWSNAYPMTRDIGYVFSAEELTAAVFLACEVVFRKRFGIRTPGSALYYAKTKKSVVADLRKKLTAKGFYVGAPNDLRSAPDRLDKADVKQTIGLVERQLSHFEGLGSKAQPLSVDSVRIETWLRQFDNDADIEDALSLVSSIKIIGRHSFIEATEAFMMKNPDFKGAFVCPLGTPKDSSYVVTYFIQDIAEKHDFSLSTLRDALDGDDKPILFVDDFIGSGGQSTAIVFSWMGQIAPVDLNEDHGPPLPLHNRDQLKKRKLGFVFAGGESEGLKKLLEDLPQLGLQAVGHVHIDADQLPRAFDGPAVHYKTPERLEKFRHRCRQIGESLLSNAGGKNREPKWCADRALGYGNKGYLIASPYNVPTQTLTLLWAEGQYQGWQWLPLLPRRRKV